MAQSKSSRRMEHLLSDGETAVGFQVESVGGNLIRWLLQAVMGAALILFVAITATIPTSFGQPFWKTWLSATKSPYYGLGGLLYGSPIFVLMFCGALYLYLFPRSSRRRMKKKASPASLGTAPLFVKGPFGVLSAAEVLGIVAFTLIGTFILAMSLIRGYYATMKKNHTRVTMWQLQLESMAHRVGLFGQICLGLLFLPVARGSVLLRIVDIPFERAAKYHVWLGHFTMAIFSFHGLTYIVTWATEGRLIENILDWKIAKVANLPGALALSVGLLMWITSFQRRNAFELFFYTHQLYILFIIFMALHVGDAVFGLVFVGIFLFTFDRFLRFCQSRKEVTVLSAKVLPCGTFELTLPRPSNLQYNALSFIFLNIPLLSHLQWHPFSVSSSPKDPAGNIKFLIKPLGTWTRGLHEAIMKASKSECPLRLTAAVEGPYGHESSYFLDYEILLLVAGGIGVSPFLAVIQDLLYRYQQGEAQLPKDVTLIWAVKSHKELRILNSLMPSAIFPGYASQLSLTVKAYVTQELAIDLETEEGYPLPTSLVIQSTKGDPNAEQKSVSHLVGSGNILWVGGGIALSLLGYVVMMGILGKIIFVPVVQNTQNTKPQWWYVRGCLFIFGTILGIWLFGGIVILLWYWVGSNSTKKRPPKEAAPLLQEYDRGEIPADQLVQSHNTIYGSRPNLEEIFEGFAKRCGSHVGVLVCGPEGLQSSVATQCRDFNAVHNKHHKVAFSYHSVSFEL